MQVKALKPHMNGYGDAFEKKVGATYDVPEHQAQVLIDSGLVEVVVASDGAAPAPKRAASNQIANADNG